MPNVREYDYLIKFDTSWSGPHFIAGREILFSGDTYEMFLIGFGGEIFRTTKPNSRSSASIVLANVAHSGKLISNHILDDPIENMEVEILEKFRDEPSARTVFKGIVRKRTLSETRITIELVEPTRTLSKLIGDTVELDDWPRARLNDVGQQIPVVLGTVEDVKLPIVEHNLSTVLDLDIQPVTLAITVRQLPEDFPTSGQVRINEELIDYSSITPGDPNTGINPIINADTRGADGTVANVHLGGSVVIVVGTWAVAFDATGLGSTVDELVTIGREENKVTIKTGDGVVGVENGHTIIRFPETQTYLEETGPSSVVRVEMDTDNGSFAANPLFVAGGSPLFTARGVVSIQGGESVRIKRAAQVPFRGKILKTILTVLHSGNQSDESAIQVATVVAGSTVLGILNANDQYDTDLQLVAAGPLRGPVDVPVPVEPGTKKIIPNTIQINLDEPGSNELNNWADPVLDPPLSFDDDDSSFGRHIFQPVVANRKARSVYKITSLPVDLDAADTIDDIRLKVRHGGEAEANNVLPGTMNMRIEINHPVGVSQAFSVVNDSIPIIDDQAAWNVGGALTVADLVNMEFEVSPVIAIGDDTGNQWIIREVFIEIDYTPIESKRDAGNVQNDFIVPDSVVSDWSDLQNLNAMVFGQASPTDPSNFFIYHMVWNVIYVPQERKIPNSVYAKVNGAVSGDPATLISQVWQTLGGNAAGTIDAASVAATSARLIAEGYVSSTIGGVVKNRQLFSLIQKIAEETRVRAYLEFSVLKLQYIEDIADLPAITRIINRDHVTELPKIVGTSIEESVRNRVKIRFDKTDLEGFRGATEILDASSIADLSEFLQNLDLEFVKNETQANKTGAQIIERKSRPYDTLSMRVTLALNDLSLLEIQSIDFGTWFTASVFEVETLIENLNHRITIQGRVLP